MKKIISVLLIAVVLVSVISVSASSAGALNIFDPPRIIMLTNTNSGIGITWTSFIGTPRYRVFVKSNGSGWKRVRDTAGNNTLDTSTHTSGTVYTYTVRGLDNNGNYLTNYDHTGWSILYVDPPTIKSLTNESNYIHVTWNSVKGASSYRLYCKVLEKDWVELKDTSGTSYDHYYPASGVSYSYMVKALGVRGNVISGGDANVKSIKYLEPPTITKVDNKSNGAQVTWKSVNGAVKYRAYYRRPGSSWVRLGDTTSTSIMHKSVTDNTRYEYTVRCISADSSHFESAFRSGYGNVYHTTPVITYAGLRGTNAAVIYFNKVSGVNRYRVFIKNGSSWKSVGDTTTNYLRVDLSICDNYAYSYGTSGVKRVGYTVRGLSDDGKKFVTDYDKIGFEFYRDAATRNWNPTAA